MRIPRFHIRTLMFVVLGAAILCVPGANLVRRYTRPKPKIRFWQVKTPYVSPSGKVWGGGVIYVG